MTLLKENQLSKSGTVPSLYLLRGVAALSVCCFHYLPSALGNAEVLKNIFNYGYLGLDLFFIISGFIIPYSMFQKNYTVKKFPRFLLKRSIRIEPPYIISFILIVLMRIMASVIHNWAHPGEHWEYNPDWTQFGLHFLYLNQYFGYESYTIVYWTLAIEFQFYLLIGILYPLIVHSKKLIPLSLLFVSSVVIYVLNLHYNWFIFQYGYLFVTGILIFLYITAQISLRNFLLLLTGILVLIYFKNGIDVAITAALATLAILKIKRRWKVSDFFGKISYSLYLTHLESGGWLMLYLMPIIPDELPRKITGLLFAILFATGFYYAFERPAFRLSKKIRY